MGGLALIGWSRQARRVAYKEERWGSSEELFHAASLDGTKSLSWSIVIISIISDKEHLRHGPNFRGLEGRMSRSGWCDEREAIQKIPDSSSFGPRHSVSYRSCPCIPLHADTCTRAVG